MNDNENLTFQKLLTLTNEFWAWMDELKERDKQDGWCVCDNCFGDRQGALKLTKLQRHCLENPQRLTMITREQEEWLRNEYKTKG